MQADQTEQGMGPGSAPRRPVHVLSPLVIRCARHRVSLMCFVIKM
jgi:hypothetical protein